MVTAYLGLGSNLGDRRKNLQDALELLDTLDDGAKVLRSSNVYETEPWGLADQPKFLNCVLEVTTTVSPEGLLALAKQVEQTLGREWSPKYGPRVIDVDVLLYGNITMDTPDLQIPHPRMEQRAFALVPLAELADGAVHPVLGLTIDQMATEVDGKDGVMLWSAPMLLPCCNPHDGGRVDALKGG